MKKWFAGFFMALGIVHLCSELLILVLERQSLFWYEWLFVMIVSLIVLGWCDNEV